MLEDVTFFPGPIINGITRGVWMSTDEDRKLRMALAQLKQEHRDLDDAILSLEALTNKDQLMLTRLKKKKLGLKDEIARLEDRLTPDIIA